MHVFVMETKVLQNSHVIINHFSQFTLITKARCLNTVEHCM